MLGLWVTTWSVSREVISEVYISPTSSPLLVILSPPAGCEIPGLSQNTRFSNKRIVEQRGNLTSWGAGSRGIYVIGMGLCKCVCVCCIAVLYFLPSGAHLFHVTHMLTKTKHPCKTLSQRIQLLCPPLRSLTQHTTLLHAKKNGNHPGKAGVSR